MAKEEPNPFDQFKAPVRTDAEANPFDQFKPAKVKAPRTGLDKATQIAGVTTDAFLPYATAAGLGAAATGIPTGGLGAPVARRCALAADPACARGSRSA